MGTFSDLFRLLGRIWVFLLVLCHAKCPCACFEPLWSVRGCQGPTCYRFLEPSHKKGLLMPYCERNLAEVRRRPVFWQVWVAVRRATPDQEEEMIRWAGHGITLVEHVLTADGAATRQFWGWWPGIQGWLAAHTRVVGSR